MKILICHSQLEFRIRLKKRLGDEFSRQRLDIEEASNEAAARGKIAEHQARGYDFLITSLELSPTPELTVDEEHRGLSLIKAVNQSGAKTQCIVLAPGQIPDMAACFAGVSCSVVAERMEMLEDLAATIRLKHSGTKIRPRLSLKLVQDPNSPNWNFWLDGDACFGLQERRGAFSIQEGHIEGLRERSEDILDGRDWLKQLGRIGQDIYAHFFDQGNSFSNLFRKAVDNAGGIDSVRLCFDIRRDYYSLAIEAVVPPAPKSPAGQKTSPGKLAFWMLKAPIYRTISVHNPSCTLTEERRPNLFQGDHEPINCLIIQADAAGEVRFPGTTHRKAFNPLLGVPEECEGLEAILLQNQVRWKIGKVQRIWPSRSPKSFKRRLFELLASRTWHIVHFCGHSYYRARKNKAGNGYLVLPGRPAEAVDAREFAHCLGKTQFLFLSSCESSNEAFAFEIARNRLPAVLGFRGGVDDRDVPFFVETFYKRLFAFRSIESAFVATRRKIRNSPGGVDNPLWASPMLVLMHPDEENEKRPVAAGLAAAASAGSIA